MFSRWTSRTAGACGAALAGGFLFAVVALLRSWTSAKNGGEHRASIEDLREEDDEKEVHAERKQAQSPSLQPNGSNQQVRAEKKEMQQRPSPEPALSSSAGSSGVRSSWPIGSQSPVGAAPPLWGPAAGAAGHWPMSPNTRRCHAPMSSSEKRDLDMMFRHQGRQEGRAPNSVDLTKAKQARQRHQLKAPAPTDVTTADAQVSDFSDDETPDVQVSEVRLSPHAVKRARKRARRREKKHADKAVPAPASLSEQGFDDDDDDDVEEEGEEEPEDVVAIPATQEVVENYDVDEEEDVEEGEEEPEDVVEESSEHEIAVELQDAGADSIKDDYDADAQPGFGELLTPSTEESPSVGTYRIGGSGPSEASDDAVPVKEDEEAREEEVTAAAASAATAAPPAVPSQPSGCHTILLGGVVSQPSRRRAAWADLTDSEEDFSHQALKPAVAAILGRQAVTTPTPAPTYAPEASSQASAAKPKPMASVPAAAAVVASPSVSEAPAVVAAPAEKRPAAVVAPEASRNVPVAASAAPAAVPAEQRPAAKAAAAGSAPAVALAERRPAAKAAAAAAPEAMRKTLEVPNPKASEAPPRPGRPVENNGWVTVQTRRSLRPRAERGR